MARTKASTRPGTAVITPDPRAPLNPLRLQLTFQEAGVGQRKRWRYRLDDVINSVEIKTRRAIQRLLVDYFASKVCSF